jgi:hypothetical protein
MSARLIVLFLIHMPVWHANPLMPRNLHLHQVVPAWRRRSRRLPDKRHVRQTGMRGSHRNSPPALRPVTPRLTAALPAVDRIPRLGPSSLHSDDAEMIFRSSQTTCPRYEKRLSRSGGNSPMGRSRKCNPLAARRFSMLAAIPGALQVEQMARDWLAANVPAQSLFDTAIRPCHSLVLAQVLVP